MPYRWTDDTPGERTLTLWPHQSLTPEGVAWFVGGTALMLSIPLVAVIGSPVAWVLMGFFVAAIVGVSLAIRSNVVGRRIHEKLKLRKDSITLQHVPRRGGPLRWEANPHWVSLSLRDDGPVENYLTLRGGGREVELGAFLTPEERQGLYHDLSRAFEHL